MTSTYLQIALGGALGAMARHGIGAAIMRIAGPGFPAGTLAVNIVGSFLMGLLAAVLAHRGGNHFAPFLLTGCLGGFTTFSAFSLDTLSLIERGQVALASGYILASISGALLAVLAGLSMGRSILT